ILGYEAGRLVGIVTIRWHSRYPPFRDRGIPLIQNIEIRYEDRGRGIGGLMMERAEQEIAQRAPMAGICVGISDSYGPAQRLCVQVIATVRADQFLAYVIGWRRLGALEIDGKIFACSSLGSAVLVLPMTNVFRERHPVDDVLRRLWGLERRLDIPNESTLSRA